MRFFPLSGIPPTCVYYCDTFVDLHGVMMAAKLSLSVMTDDKSTFC